jgi:hypothetical protein
MGRYDAVAITIERHSERHDGHHHVRYKCVCTVSCAESFIGLTGGHDSAFIGLSYLSMFLPTISVLIVTFSDE